MLGDTDISPLASLLADPEGANLLALGDGRALAASVPADEAGVALSTASTHLSKLVAGGLLDGRAPRTPPVLPARRPGGRRAAAGGAQPPVGREADPLAPRGHPGEGDPLRAHVLRPPRRRARNRPDGRADRRRDARGRRRRVRSDHRRERPPVLPRVRFRLPAHARRGRAPDRVRDRLRRAAAPATADPLLHRLVRAAPPPGRPARPRSRTRRSVSSAGSAGPSTAAPCTSPTTAAAASSRRSASTSGRRLRRRVLEQPARADEATGGHRADDDRRGAAMADGAQRSAREQPGFERAGEVDPENSGRSRSQCSRYFTAPLTGFQRMTTPPSCRRRS